MCKEDTTTICITGKSNWCRAMSSNTPEFQTVLGCTSDLSRAVKADILPLSNELLSEGFMSQENHDRLNNQMHDATLRAAHMVSLVRTKVQLNPANFHKFVKILLAHPEQHREILERLEHKYRSCGGDGDTGITAALALLVEQDRAANQIPVIDRSQHQSDVHQETPTVATTTPVSTQVINNQCQSSVAPSTATAMTTTPVSTQSSLTFSVKMSDEEFQEWLRVKGISKPEDLSKILSEGINAISLQHLEEDDVKEVISKLSPGGRGVFKTIWRENRLVIPRNVLQRNVSHVKLDTRLVVYVERRGEPGDEAFKKEDTLDSNLDKELVHKSRMHSKISRFLQHVPLSDLKRLGGSLGISHSKILRMSEPELAEDLVAAWLRREDTVLEVGKPTLRILATHLKTIGQNGLAHDIISTDGSCIG